MLLAPSTSEYIAPVGAYSTPYSTLSLRGAAMNAIGVAVYSLAVAKSNSRKHLELSAFEGASDLLTVLLATIQNVEKKTQDVIGASKKFQIRDVVQKKRKIDGIIEVGNFGYGSSLRDIKTGNENYKRKISDAEMIPLYFCIWIPQKGTRGVLALQYFGEVGVKSGFQDLLETSFKAKFANHSLRVRKLVSDALIKNAIEKEHISKLRFISHGIPKDVADAYGDQAHDPDSGGYAEFVVRIGKKDSISKGARKRLSGILSGETEMKDVLELDGFEYQEVRAEVDMGGRTRTIRFNRPDGISSKIDVTDNVKTDADGHPTRASIAVECDEIIEHFAVQLNT